MVCAQPQRAIAGFTNRIDLVVHNAVGSEAAQTSTVDTEKTCGPSRENHTVAPLAQAEERDVTEVGRLVYAFPEDATGFGQDVADALARWALTVEPSGNLVVVTTPYGYAQALAQAIDVARPPHLAGTVAGENTVLLIAREPTTGAQLADEIRAQREAA